MPWRRIRSAAISNVCNHRLGRRRVGSYRIFYDLLVKEKQIMFGFADALLLAPYPASERATPSLPNAT